MRNSAAIKAVAIVLASVALLAAVGGGIGIIAMAETGLYNRTVAEIKTERMQSITASVADHLVREYIKENLSNMTENALRNSGFYDSHSYYWYEFNTDLGVNGWYYHAQSKDGKTVAFSGNGERPAEFVTYTHVIQLTYPKLLHYQEVPQTGHTEPENVTTPTTETSPTVPARADECLRWYNDETGTYFDYYFEYCESPAIEVRISLPADYCVGYSEGYWFMAETLVAIQGIVLPCLLAGLAVFAAAMIYLVAAAGHGRENVHPRAGGLNRLPLDLYTAVAVGGVTLLIAAGASLMDWMSWDNGGGTYYEGLAALTVLSFLGAAVIAVGYLFALAAQFKTPDGFWWRNSVIGLLLRCLWRGCRYLWRWSLRLLSMVNTMWQWLIVAGALCCGWLLVLIVSHVSAVWVLLFLMVLGATLAAAGYGAYAFGVIFQGARRMADGDLNRKISSKHLVGSFADCAGRLNALADVAVVAAQKQLKSDRMKTELITNVSHDIKTPLTSIINYVDLLRKPHTEAEGEEYLAVLARQSGQMKKLIDDLMDMSKAATGNMNMELTEMDAVEAVNQALGEFADKLAAVPLIPVVRCPDTPVMIRADGRLLWRTLSNLLQNAVKYALPGTRLYLDVTRVDGNAVISLKNISREELNISADELMERFVRGDASRNTEGSGLGLNIAKSLMELQHGQLRVLVDGDLFKTSLIIPAAE